MQKQVISFLLLSIILLTSCFEGPAQTNDWATVRALGKHSGVIVEPRSGKRVTGILYTAADTEMTVITRDNTMIAIKQDDVRRIFHALPRSKRKARIRGVIYGTLAGFAAAAAVDSAGPSNAQDTRPGMVMVFTAIGIGSWIYKRGTKGVKKGALIYEAN